MRRALLLLVCLACQRETSVRVVYACEGHEGEPVVAAFDDVTDPPTVTVTFGDRHATLPIAPSASGARYASEDVELWEHQGEATLRWSDVTLRCKPR